MRCVRQITAGLFIAAVPVALLLAQRLRAMLDEVLADYELE